MSLNWRWNEKCGEAIIKQEFAGEVKEFTKTLYEGNAFLIFLNEWDEDDQHMYSLYTFFADEVHAKRCLGITKNADNIYYNMFDGDIDKLVKIRINKKKSRNWKKIVTLFAQAFDNIDIEIYTEEDKND